MSREFVGVTEGEPIADVVDIMCQEDTGNVIVMHGTEPVGVATARELLATVVEEGTETETAVSRVMRSVPDPIAADADLSAAVTQLSNDAVGAAPVVDVEGQLVGVISESDLVAVSASMTSTDETTATTEAVPGGEPEGGVTGPVSPGTGGTSEASAGNPHERPTRDEELVQGVCEACGSITSDLVEVNGQILCPDCRSVA